MFAWATMENNDDGWDLFAVVRSCRTASRPPEASPSPQVAKTALPNRPAEGPAFPSCFPRGISHFDLEKLCSKPFSYDALQSKLTPVWSCSSSPAAASTPAPARRPLTQSIPRSKRRRSQQKRVVCHVAADGLAADMWAWRKYGQKPIKGSPYPRGYYRCSSSKGCLARKQVERSRTDAGIFVITYTGEHNHPIPTHRNSLAGSSRQKFPAAVASGDQANLPEGSPNTPLKTEEGSGEEDEDEDEEEEGLLLVEDMEVVGEDAVLFMGVENLQGSSSAAVSSPVMPEAIAAFFGQAGGPDDSFLVQPWPEDGSSRR